MRVLLKRLMVAWLLFVLFCFGSFLSGFIGSAVIVVAVDRKKGVPRKRNNPVRTTFPAVQQHMPLRHGRGRLATCVIRCKLRQVAPNLVWRPLFFVVSGANSTISCLLYPSRFLSNLFVCVDLDLSQRFLLFCVLAILRPTEH